MFFCCSSGILRPAITEAKPDGRVGMTIETVNKSARSRMSIMMFIAASLLAACSTSAPSADRLELVTIEPKYVIPKSTPLQLIAGFDRFCVKTPGGPAAQETALRNAGYVPTNTTRGETRQVFLIDNKLPAIGISPQMCIARATARNRWKGNRSSYSVILFKPNGEGA